MLASTRRVISATYGEKPRTWNIGLILKFTDEKVSAL